MPGLQAAGTAPHRSPAGFPRFPSEQFARSVSEARSSAEIAQTIRGALLYLDDTQVRDRPGLHSPFYDYCRPEIRSCNGANLNVAGEWASSIRFLPDRVGVGRAKISFQDSNAFVTAGILYPLYFIDDGRMPEDERLAENMRSIGAASLAEFKRGDAYNFWVQLNAQTSGAPKTGPLNIRIRQVQLGAMLISYPLYPVWKVVTVGLDVDVDAWLRRVLNRSENPHGFDSVFNIPNDADDTAIVVAIQKLHSELQPQDRITPDLAALRLLTRHRDIGRARKDARIKWRGNTDTGAYLTWLKDEDLGTFSDPETGVIPLGVNNIDCVVNANAVFSLALNEAHGWPGFEDAKTMLRTITDSRAWRDACVLYYPQLMMPPYTLARAYRDGQLSDDPAMRQTMGILLRDLLEMQRKDGSFPGGKDRTRHLSTALATSALINIGASIADQHGLFDDYQLALDRAVGYLVSSRRPHRLMFSGGGPSGGGGPAEDYGYKWASGLFFAGSYRDLAHWHSQPYTTAIVLEALVKYALAYDLTESTVLTGKRWRVQSYHLPGAEVSGKQESSSRTR